MTTPEPHWPQAALFELLEQYVSDQQAGRTFDLDACISRMPEHADLLRGEHARLESIAAGSQSDESEQRIGPFRIVREIGAGGQAIVYEAVESIPPRRVALKVLKVGPGRTERALARFTREAEILAQLDDPGICPLYSTGTEHGIAWIAMRYVEGETIAQMLAREKQKQVNFRDAERIRRTLRWIERVLRSLHRSHEAGVTHRDLKPSNIILDRRQSPILLDFGLARTDDDRVQTLTMDRLGTPAFMAPEQIEGEQASRQSDIYSIGLTAFEALTGARAFDRAPSHSLYRAIVEGRLPRSRAVAPWFPRDLCAVLDMATARSRDRRYSTADAFADDIARVIRGEPTIARPLGVGGRLLAWTRRNPALAAALVIAFASLSAVLTVTLALNVELRNEQASTREALDRARGLGLASEAQRLAETEPQLGLALALEAIELEERAETRTAVYSNLARVRLAVEQLGDQGSPRVARLMRDRSGLLIGYDAAVVVWRFGDRPNRLATDRAVESVHELPDGRILATLKGRNLQCWARSDSATWRHQPIAVPVDRVESVGVSTAALYVGLTDGRILAERAIGDLEEFATFESAVTELEITSTNYVIAALGDGDVVVIDPEGHETARWPMNGATPLLQVIEEGQRVLSTMTDDNGAPALRLHEIRTGRFALIRTRPTPFSTARLSPDGQRLVYAHDSDRPSVLDLRTRSITTIRGHRAPVGPLAFNGSGDLLTGSEDQTAKLFSKSGDVRFTLRGHDGNVGFVGFANDGRLVTVCAGGTARIWNRRAPVDIELGGDAEWVGRAYAGGRAGEFLVTCEHGVRLVIPGSSADSAILLPAADRAATIAKPDPSGAHVLVVETNGSVTLWNRSVQRLAQATTNPRIPIVTFVGHDRFAVGNAGQVTVTGFDGRVHARFDTGTPLSAIAASPDGKHIVTGDFQGNVSVFDAAGTQIATHSVASGLVTRIRFRASGGLFAVASTAEHIELFDSNGRNVARLGPNGNGVRTIEFSSDGTQLVSGSDDGIARIWSLDGEELARMEASGQIIRQAIPSPDGKRLATLDARGRVSIWSTSGQHEASLPDLGRQCLQIEWLRGGRYLLTSGGPSAVRRWPVEREDLVSLARTGLVHTWTEQELARFAEWRPPENR